MIAAFASLLLAAGSPALGDARALDALVEQIYAPYRNGNGNPAPYWQRPIFDAATQQLIAVWAHNHAHDAVSEADMLCGCQDWDAGEFRVEILTRQFTGPNRAVLLLRVWPVKGGNSAIRLSLVKEGARWVVDDIGDPGGSSLTVLLRRALSR